MLVRDQFTVADAYLFVVTRWAAFLKIDLSDYANFQVFQERVSATPAVTSRGRRPEHVPPQASTITRLTIMLREPLAAIVEILVREVQLQSTLMNKRSRQVSFSDPEAAQISRSVAGSR